MEEPDGADGQAAFSACVVNHEGAGVLAAALEGVLGLRPAPAEVILEAAEVISSCFFDGGKLLIAGNGGSAADSLHFASELVGRFKVQDRPGLPAMVLSADTATLTAWANDMGYEHVFADWLG